MHTGDDIYRINVIVFSSYLQNWLSVLKSDKRFIINATGLADKAIKLIRNETEQEVKVDAAWLHPKNHRSGFKGTQCAGADPDDRIVNKRKFYS